MTLLIALLCHKCALLTAINQGIVLCEKKKLKKCSEGSWDTVHSRAQCFVEIVPKVFMECLGMAIK